MDGWIAPLFSSSSLCRLTSLVLSCCFRAVEDVVEITKTKNNFIKTLFFINKKKKIWNWFLCDLCE